jgi:CBS domain containing-hemolysin-like protein
MFLFILLFLIGLFCLSAVNTAFRRLQKKDSIKQVDSVGKRFFYRYLVSWFFPAQEFRNLYFSVVLTQNALRFIYALLSLFLLAKFNLVYWGVDTDLHQLVFSFSWTIGFPLLILFFTILFVVGDYCGSLFGNCYPALAIQVFAPIVSFLMTPFFPLTFILLKLAHLLPKTIYFDPLDEHSRQGMEDLMAILEEYHLDSHLDSQDTKLIVSVMDFKGRIAREVMVPRVDVFSLPHNMTIEQAAKLLYKEGYSRTPVYKETLDNIIGVLMYKDILAQYMEHIRKEDRSNLEKPIETLVKNILYVPETKKISHLLQEFRKKQVHLAIVVDEYGGTEGIVSIEDILEAIVGEIADEYDQEEALFLQLPEGGWLIDPRMNILDIEAQLGIEIPQDGDYDTIGGYVFHETGMIPNKGYIIRQPNFEIEVIRSNNRRVEKLRINPINQDLDQDEDRL